MSEQVNEKELPHFKLCVSDGGLLCDIYSWRFVSSPFKLNRKAGEKARKEYLHTKYHNGETPQSSHTYGSKD